MSDTIARKNASSEEGVYYHLDFMVWDRLLEPTWLALPAPSQYMKSLNVDVRTVKHAAKQWSGRGESPGALPLLLLQLLSRFFNHGPRLTALKHGCRQARSQIRVELLTVNLPSVPTAVTPWLTRRGPGGWEKKSFPRESIEQLTHHNFRFNLERLVESGLLFPMVKRLRLRHSNDVDDWEITDRGDTTLAAKNWEVNGEISSI